MPPHRRAGPRRARRAERQRPAGVVADRQRQDRRLRLPALQCILSARLDPAKKRAKGAPNGPRILVLAPTRELAQQVSKACTEYGYGVQGLRVAHVVGGVPYQAQLKALRAPLDVLIATPGRLLDLMNRALPSCRRWKC